jgi:hypothetical protein
MTSTMERLDKYRDQVQTKSARPVTSTEVVELSGARIFFPDERATELTAALRRHWDAHT